MYLPLSIELTAASFHDYTRFCLPIFLSLFANNILQLILWSLLTTTNSAQWDKKGEWRKVLKMGLLLEKLGRTKSEKEKIRTPNWNSAIAKIDEQTNRSQMSGSFNSGKKWLKFRILLLRFWRVHDGGTLRYHIANKLRWEWVKGLGIRFAIFCFSPSVNLFFTNVLQNAETFAIQIHIEYTNYLHQNGLMLVKTRTFFE